MSKVIAFIKARPTETWLGGYTALVAVLTAAGVSLEPALVAAVGTLIAWLLTLIASRPNNGLGP